MKDNVFVSEDAEGWPKMKRKIMIRPMLQWVPRKPTKDKKVAVLGFWPRHTDPCSVPAGLNVLAIITQSQEDPGCR